MITLQSKNENKGSYISALPVSTVSPHLKLQWFYQLSHVIFCSTFCTMRQV